MDPVLAARQGGFSILAGLFFGAGWWALIDGVAVGQQLGDNATAVAAGYSWLPLFGASVAFFMVNGMTWGELQDNEAQPATAAKARIFLLCALFVLIASMAGAAFIMVQKFLQVSGSYQWAGISGLVGTMLLAVATFVMRFGTIPTGPSET